jgi:cell division protein FtsN
MEEETVIEETPVAASPEPAAPQVASAPEESAAEVSVLTESSGKEFYRIQVYSSKKRSEAEARLGELKEQGLDAFMKEVRSTGKPWYVVYAGPYSRLEPARRDLETLKQSGHSPILLSINRAG